MENAQVMAPDGSWFLFVDWQGATRIAFPGDKVKTDANLDRPGEKQPIVRRPEGTVRSTASIDIEPVALKKVKRSLNFDCPDPLGGEIVAAPYEDEITIRRKKVPLGRAGAPVKLGATRDLPDGYMEDFYAIYPDGSVVLIGRTSEEGTKAALVVRGKHGMASAAWCRKLLLAPSAAPVAFRGEGSVVLAARDITVGIASLAELRDDGTTLREESCSAIAGPWLLDGQIWWQPDVGTIFAGAKLGQPAQSFKLPRGHAGPGRLLRASGRKLFLPWHGVALIDLAPAKKEKAVISRKHKARDEAMYRAAEEMMRPTRALLARRGIHLAWNGCTRTTTRVEPDFTAKGRADLISYTAGYLLQDALTAKLRGNGVTSATFSGSGHFDDICAPDATGSADDLRALVALHDELEVSRALGLAHLCTLYEVAGERRVPPPLTAEAEGVVLDALLSALRPEKPPAPGKILAATATALKTAAALLAAPALQDAGIRVSDTAKLIAVIGHRRFGAAAAAPILKVLASHHASEVDEVNQLLAYPAPT